MKKLPVLLFLFFVQISYAQTDVINSPFLISSSGGNWIMDNYNLCFSLGEIAIETYDQQDMVLTQGFHQENNYQITVLEEHLYNYEILLYPNPTQNILHLSSAIDTDVVLNLKDIKGSVISNFNDINLNEKYSIDLTSFSPGIYFLEVFLNKNQKQVYQIQKFN